MSKFDQAQARIALAKKLCSQVAPHGHDISQKSFKL